ncbi:MAG: calcium/sodium antiporter [Bacteroidales bacterium]|jgi:cation:H+ antiporter|nr:calcium/sodium antiporter [Bacteroidales bacterium]
MWLDILYVLIGFVLLIKGGDFLVDGAVSIAKRAKISPMVIGLTIVGFGTSSPELLVSIQAALSGSSGIALGNVVGSNIANIALILGTAAIVKECVAQKMTLKVDMPFMFLVSGLFVGIAMSGTISRIAGIIGFLLLCAFIIWEIKHYPAQTTTEEDEKEPMPIWKALIVVVLSFGALVYGSDKLVEGASNIAKSLGVTDRIIGLTIVAIGTSLPELFASVAAAKKGQTDMAIGNVVGSAIFNILSVVGISAAICPIENSNVGFLTDYICMVALSGLLWFFLSTKQTLERWEGITLVTIYAGYIACTVIFS